MKGAELRELETAYRRGLDSYCSVAAAILEDRDAARDAVQDAFARAVRGRARFRREGPLEAWLWRAVVNAAIDERRRRAAALPLADALDRVASANGELSAGGHGAVRHALAQLPERQRLIIFLRYYADLDYRTIGEALGITTGAIGATLHAAHGALRSTLEEVAP